MTKDGSSSGWWSRLRGALAAPDVTSGEVAFQSQRAPASEDDVTGETDIESSGDYFAQGFGLRQRAFTLLPDPDFLYWSPDHKRAYSILEYGIMTRSPITVMTGEVGAGKTTLLQALLEKVGDDTIVGLISNAQGNRGDLLRWALAALDVPCDRNASYVETFQVLQDFLVRNYASGRYAILIIDEAQQLSQEGLEELRMLTNINSGKDELLQLVLVGQPELREVISRPEMAQFAQRIMATYHLRALDQPETAAYIRHRLVHAGGQSDQFTDPAVELVYRYSGGVPRLINKICDFSIVYAATSRSTVVDAQIVQTVINDGLLQGTSTRANTGEIAP